MKVLILLLVIVAVGTAVLIPVMIDTADPVLLRPVTVLMATLAIPAAVRLIPVIAPVPLILFAILFPILLLLILHKVVPPLAVIIVIAPDPPVMDVNVFALITLLVPMVVDEIPVHVPLLLVLIFVKLLVLIF